MEAISLFHQLLDGSSPRYIFLLLLIVYLSTHVLKYGSNYPGPFLFPLVGCFPQIWWHRGELYDWSTRILQRCKRNTYTSFSLGFKGVITADPKVVEYILKDNFGNYPKGPVFQDNFRDLLGHGIFNSDGEAWLKQRKSASVQFSAASLRDLIVNSVRKETTQRLIPTLQKAVETGSAIDFQDVLLRYTFDNICQVGFGVDPHCLAPDFPVVPFAEAFDQATKATLARFRLPPGSWRLGRWLSLGSEGRLIKALEVIRSFGDSIIEKRRNELTGEGEKSGSFSDLLSRFILLQREDNCQLYSSTFLRDACTNFILAGRDTSSVALTWLFWLLTWHTDVESKILEEIRGILGKRAETCRTDPCFSFEELKEMHFLQACLSETLRLYPSVPADSKYVLKEDVLPDGTRVFPGWRVTYLVYAMGRMQSIWGPDAAAFRPDRWITDEGRCRAESAFKFPAFNAGPRLCLGKDMAYLQMKSIAATVLRDFRLTLLRGHSVRYGLSLTLFMKDGLVVTVEPR